MTFPNLKGKHAYDSMFSPKEFVEYAQKGKKEAVPRGRAPENIIICYSKSLLKRIVEKEKTKAIQTWYGDMHLLKSAKYNIGIAGGFGIGAPMAAIIMDEFIAWGVKKFVTIGTAGTLQKNLSPGDVVVCDKAIRDEGTSFHYVKPSKYAYASKDLTKRIEKALGEMKQEFIIGTTWTIDAPYRETVREARQYQKEGVLTVEMEVSALFAVGKYRKVDVGAILTVSDSLAEMKWKPAFHYKRKEKAMKIIYEAAERALMK